MLGAGVFGGQYFEDMSEFPAEWSAAVALRGPPGPSHNMFGVRSGLSREEWAAKGWLRPQDPLGWFQWYCRYTLGRRTDDDVRQIARHNAFRRHAAQVAKHGAGDLLRRRVQRQALLQWAHEPDPDCEKNIFIISCRL